MFILDSGQKTLIIQVMSLMVSLSNDYIQQHKDLGVTFSIDLNWAAHHKVITVKAYQTLGIIRRTFKTGCSTEAKKKLYIALVHSQLIYCSQLWRPQLIKDITALERIQRRATKYIY